LKGSIVVKQSFAGPAPPPVTVPVLAMAARKAAVILLSYARARRQAARKAQEHAAKVPVREFGCVQLHGQVFGAVYEDGELIAVIPDVGRM
jgi:hypothetical protein